MSVEKMDAKVTKIEKSPARYYSPQKTHADTNLAGMKNHNDEIEAPLITEWVKETDGLPDPLADLVTYVYQEAVSPHLAARINHRPVELETIREAFQKARARHEYLTMEGSGGILCPLRWDERQHLLLEDMIRALDLGCLLVADAGLGTINSTVLTVEYLQHRSIPVRGILFNRWKPGDRMQEDNRAMVEELTGIPVLACVKEGDRELEGPLDGLLAAFA